MDTEECSEENSGHGDFGDHGDSGDFKITR